MGCCCKAGRIPSGFHHGSFVVATLTKGPPILDLAIVPEFLSFLQGHIIIAMTRGIPILCRNLKELCIHIIRRIPAFLNEIPPGIDDLSKGPAFLNLSYVSDTITSSQ
jgi:hypothetical protein